MFSCLPDKDIHVFYQDRQFLSHPGPDKNHVYLMLGCIGNYVSTSSGDVGFYSRYVKNDVTMQI